MAFPDEHAVDSVIMALELYGYTITPPETGQINYGRLRLAIANALWGKN